MSPEEPDEQEQLDFLEELKRSNGYRLVAQRIVSVVETKRDALESNAMISEPDEANHTRGMIAGLKLALRIPSIMQGEIEGDIKRKVKR